MTLPPLAPRHTALAGRVLSKSLFALVLLWPLVLLVSPPSMGVDRFYDGATYYRAGQAYLAGIDPYLDADFRQWPVVAALCAPMALLPRSVALLLMSTLSMLGGLVGLACVRQRLRREGVASPRLCWALIISGPPFLMLFYFGQMTGLSFAAYGAGLLLVERRPRLAAVCFALLAAKPHLALIALPALIAAGPGAVVVFGLAALAWPIGSLLAGGAHGLADFAGQLILVRTDLAAKTSVPIALLLPLHGQALAAAQLLFLVALLVFLGWLAIGHRRAGRPINRGDIDAAAAVVLATLPYGLTYDLIFVAPALLRLGARCDRRVAAFLASWWLLPLAAPLLIPFGLGGVQAIIPPAAAGLWLHRRRSTASARIDRHRRRPADGRGAVRRRGEAAAATSDRCGRRPAATTRPVTACARSTASPTRRFPAT
jgi:hypothetical protein